MNDNISFVIGAMFLKNFHFSLDILNDTKANIINEEGQIIGLLSIQDGKVLFNALSNKCSLIGSYNVLKRTSNHRCLNKISFSYTNELVSLNGDYYYDIINNTIGSAHLKMEFAIPNFGTGRLLMHLMNSMFLLRYVSSDNIEEIITINPHDLTNYMYHNISAPSYQKTSSITKVLENNTDKLMVFHTLEEEGKTKAIYRNYVLDIFDNKKESVLQKAKLMRKLDGSMYKKLKEFHNLLFLNNTNLLDNFMEEVYKSYTEEEIESLFAFKEKVLKRVLTTN